ncbi:hypothetical protein ES288_A10G076800v1 [Gossypium darwinii]|uniref:NB-ARC domain-containing protein n=1 Tax=Gossypium darwinii TaxID=34276 RepID=A0A5D2EWF0_GOSDA|nr:hypothetical protein ES288_A10G076800v1 [Gossypium darwinii]
MLKEVEEHIQKGKFYEGLVVDNPQWIGQVLSLYLMDDEVQKIGVCGMGGVGKTSIMKVINNQILKETWNFNSVIWITVSKEMSTAKLQKDIASKIGVTFSGDEDEIKKAGMLFETLSRKSRFLMILDDLWDKIFLDKVGIPEPSAGSKIVLTTRSFDVCQQVGCCRVKLGRVVLNIPNLEPIAKSIANQCAGLPLAIISSFLVETSYVILNTSCMKGIDDLYNRRNALKELSLYIKSVNGLEDDARAKWTYYSYDRLKDLKLQHCFLKVTKMGNERCVKMHDLPPNVQEWNKDLEKPLQMSPPKCPILTTFLLSNCRITSIPEGFFKHKHALKILDLSRNPIMSLPISIANLKNLTALLLGDCQNLEKELDLHATNIRQVPHGMENLSRLKYLNMNHVELDEIPIGILSNLSCLQNLIIGEMLIRGEELHGLKKLEILKGTFYDLQSFNIYVQSLHYQEEPREYVIHVGKKGCRNAIYSRKYIELCCSLQTACRQIYKGFWLQRFCFLQLKRLVLKKLPELKEYLSVDRVVVCDSLDYISVANCLKLKRMPLYLSQLHNFQPSPSHSLFKAKGVVGNSRMVSS